MIYLIDNIGTETGMHLYNSMFYENFAKAGKRVQVLSNYSDGHTRKLFCNFYHGNKLLKVFRFGMAVFRTIMFSLLHRNNTFIYQSFGLRKIDQIFIRAISCRNKYVLVHDIFDIKDLYDDEIIKNRKILFYKRFIHQVICHSKRTEEDLRSMGYDGKIVYFPHFRYNYDEQMKNYKESNVGEDVKKSIMKGKYNFLFFGQVRESKGIDVVLGCLEQLNEIDNINFIVAGTDKQNMVNLNSDKLKKILRYINNDEMMFLYSHCDFVLLPYKEVYQSGVMESMLYFKKPGIMSDVKYFANIGKEFPSFGIVYSPNEAKSLAVAIRNVSEGKYNNYQFYSENDVQRYNDAHDVTNVISKEF